MRNDAKATVCAKRVHGSEEHKKVMDDHAKEKNHTARHSRTKRGASIRTKIPKTNKLPVLRTVFRTEMSEKAIRRFVEALLTASNTLVHIIDALPATTQTIATFVDTLVSTRR